MPSAMPACTAHLLHLLCLLLATPGLGQIPVPRTENTTLTNCVQVRRLTPEEAARSPKVLLRAVVTFSDGDSGLLFVQDETGGVYVNPLEPVTLAFGTMVELDGVAQPGSHLSFVSRAILFERGPARTPPPLNVTFDELAQGIHDSTWVQTQGVVQSVQTSGSQVRLVLGANGRRVLARVFESSEWVTDPAELVDAEVRLRGVAGATNSGGGDSVLLDILVPHPRLLTVTTPGTPLAKIPFRPVAWIKDNLSTNALSHRIRVQGRLEREPGQPLALRDGADRVVLTTPSLRLAATNNALVVAAGFPAGNPLLPRLEGVVVSLLAPGGGVSGERSESGAGKSGELLPVLSAASQVRRLSTNEASRGYPVSIQGVITFSHMGDNGGRLLFVQDASAGIYVRDDEQDPGAFPPGSLVELEGFSDPGEFAPIIRKTRITKLGEGPMPVPRVVTIDDLLTGRWDSQRVRLNGVITRVDAGPRTVTMMLLAGGTTLAIVLPRDVAMENWDRLVDAEVRVTGVCGTTFNTKRQLEGLNIFARRGGDVLVLKAAPADVFDVPLRPIRNLYQFNLNQDIGHRIRVQGVMTLRVEGEGLFIQDQSDGMFIPMKQSEDCRIGDEVEVIGFPRPGHLDAMLLEARSRRLRSGAEPKAAVVTQADLASGDHDNRLVSIDATVSEKRGDAEQPFLVCRDGAWVFEVRGNARGGMSPVAVGSRVRVTGVWVAQKGAPSGFGSPRLLMRSASDLVVLERPSWWKPRVAAAVGGGLLLTILLALVWVVMLRREVRIRTQQSQKALAMFEASIAQSPSGILIADAPDVTIRWANSAALGIRGESAEALTGIDLGLHAQRWQTLRPDRTPYADHELPLSRAVLEGKVIRNEELLIRNHEGMCRWVVANAAPIRDGQGAISAGIVIFHDITDRKRAEEDRERLQAQLLQAQKMESVGRLAGGVAHDFNNMLQAILGNASLALEENPGPGQLREHLEEIQKAAERSADLTRHLLAFARKQTVSPRILDLNDTVSGMLRMLRRLIGENIQLHWIPGPALWSVKIDPSQLDQVLANLTVNAKDAIQGAGKIAIKTSNVTLAAGHDVPECVPGDYVELLVQDSGCGMSTEVLEHLFEPFFTTKPVGKGTGLGLATVYGIVRQNGGGIRVVSKPGEGTTFVLLFPRSEPPSAPVEAATRGERYRGTETILLVEDEPMVLGLGMRVLEQHGYTVLSAAMGERALQVAADYRGQIDLLVTDVIMPGMNGRELRDRLSEARPGMRCLFISGYPADSITQGGVLEEGVQFLQKPFEVDELTRRVREVLG